MLIHFHNFFTVRLPSLNESFHRTWDMSLHYLLEYLSPRWLTVANGWVFYTRVSTASGNLEFNWSSWKFLTDGTTTKESRHKNLAPFLLFGRWWWWLCIILVNVYVYLVDRMCDLWINCRLKFGKVPRVNVIGVISGVRVLLKCLLEIVRNSPGNLFGWICRHPVYHPVHCVDTPLLLPVLCLRVSSTYYNLMPITVIQFMWTFCQAAQVFIYTVCLLCCVELSVCSLLVSVVALISLRLISLFSSLSAPRLIYLFAFGHSTHRAATTL